LVRTALADLYGGSSEEEMPGLYDAVAAEVWLYGLLLVIVGLGRAARQHDCPPRGRTAAWVLGAMALITAATRVPALWMPAYGAAALHTLLLLRRELELRFLWSLVPLVPLAALLTVELWAGYLYREARALQVNKNYAAAAMMYEQALAVPARSQKLGARVRLSQCQRELADFAAAEATLLRAVKMGDRPDWPHCGLAGLYMDSRAKHTPQFRPEEAARILREVVDGLSPAMVKAHARRKLDRLRRQGLIE
jgi:tetratricopeptide (TPR) repeat protein